MHHQDGKPRIVVHGHDSPETRQRRQDWPYRAMLEGTQLNDIGGTEDEAIDGLIGYVNTLGWPKSRDGYVVVTHATRAQDGATTEPGRIYVYDTTDPATPEVAITASLIGTMFSGYGPSADKALDRLLTIVGSNGLSDDPDRYTITNQATIVA